MNKMEIFNEISLLVIFAHLFLFSGYVTTTRQKYDIGWAFIGVVGLNFLTNLSIITYNSIMEWKF